MIEELEETPDITFDVVARHGELSIVARPENGGHDIPVIDVVAGDAIGYENRDTHGRHISVETVARYWAEILDDTVSVFLRSRPPSRLANTHAGRALRAVYDLSREERPNGHIPARVVEDVIIEGLSREQTEHLAAMAFYVPGDLYRAPQERDH